MTDIIDLIDQDTAPACGWCQQLLGDDNLSMYWCDAECQAKWNQLRSEPLVGCCEPDPPQHWPAAAPAGTRRVSPRGCS